MLKHPKKNFGLLPSNEMLAHLFIAIGLCLVPSVVSIGVLLFGEGLSSNQLVAIIPRMLILGLYLMVLKSTPGGWKTLYSVSRRRRYVQKVLAPYFRKRYGFKMMAHDNMADAVFLGNPLKLKGRNAATDVMILGWPNIENLAMGDKLDEPIEKSIYAVQPLEDGTALELPIRNQPDSEREKFFPRTSAPVERIPELAETEHGIQAMLTGIIHSLPPGDTILKCVAPSSSEMGIESEIRVTVEPDNRVTYSLKDVASLEETILFNVRLSESALVVCIVETITGKKYICGQLVRNAGYSDLPAEVLRSISNTEDIPDFIFVKNAKEMHP